MRYQVSCDRAFTEEDIAELVEQELLGEGNLFLSVALLLDGSFVVSLERSASGFGDEDRIEEVLRSALRGSSEKLRIQRV